MTAPILLPERTRAAIERRVRVRVELQQAFNANETAIADIVGAAAEMLAIPDGWQYADGAFVAPQPGVNGSPGASDIPA